MSDTEMDLAHRSDMRTDSAIASVLPGLRELAVTLAGRKSGTALLDAIAWLEDERASIVRRWD